MRYYTYDELLQCSWRPTMRNERVSLVRFREPKTLYKEKKNRGQSCPLVNKV